MAKKFDVKAPKDKGDVAEKKGSQKPMGKKASQETSQDMSAKAAKMGSSHENFGDSDVKQGFKTVAKMGQDNGDGNKGEYKYAPGSTNNDSRPEIDGNKK